MQKYAIMIAVTITALYLYDKVVLPALAKKSG